MRIPLFVAFQVFIVTSTVAQTVVPITSEPSHHLIISNQYVRVFEVEVPPKAETLYHQHDYDYLYVAIGDADVTSFRLNEKPAQVKLKDGDVELAKGPFAHKAVNNGDRPFRNVTVELLGGSGESICGHPGGDICGAFSYWGNGSRQGEVIHTTKVEVNDVWLKGKSGIGPFSYPYLLVAVSDLSLQQSSQNRTTEIAIHAGKAFWNDQLGAKLDNSSGLAKFILIGFPAAKTQ
jgi:hypothetical protein